MRKMLATPHPKGYIYKNELYENVLQILKHSPAPALSNTNL